MTRRFAVTAALAILANGACNSPYSPSHLGTPPGTGKQGALKLDASMVEYEYGANKWFYMPQMRVTETTGAGGVRVTAARFSIPATIVRGDCLIGARVEPGKTLDLVPTAYDDLFPAVVGNGERAPGQFSVVLSLVDDSGRQDSISVSLPVVLGGLPYKAPAGATFSCDF